MQMFNDTYKPSIYSASKIWHNLKWREMRDVHGYPITARWINVECGTYENPTGAKQLTPTEKTQLWIECAEDVKKCDFVAIYGEPRDEQRGATVEFGMALGMNRPIYVIGNCPFFGANSHSDAAYMHHPLVHRVGTEQFADGSYDYVTGYMLATAHYRLHYHTPERLFERTEFLARTPGSGRGFHQSAIAA